MTILEHIADSIVDAARQYRMEANQVEKLWKALPDYSPPSETQLEILARAKDDAFRAKHRLFEYVGHYETEMESA